MTHNYTIEGMTCGSCEAKVKSALLSMPHVLSAEVSKETKTATVEMEKHIAISEFQKALGGEQGKYRIMANHQIETAEQSKSWINTYKPILLIFGYILVITLLIEYTNHGFIWMRWMNHFMAGFFLVFSFFKLLNLRGFAESYSMYDIVARKWNGWGYGYAFAELVLGLLFLTGFFPLFTNGVTFVLMTISLAGVLQSVFNKRKIQCACLGTVFNLPMSTVTIIEDALMIAMSAVMCVILL